ncbi:MAG: hypothetical protein HY796_03990 [Elusimicrobia bacterium]|nr:hypothetical protein [Elusimicrobiota bacterium]
MKPSLEVKVIRGFVHNLRLKPAAAYRLIRISLDGILVVKPQRVNAREFAPQPSPPGLQPPVFRRPAAALVPAPHCGVESGIIRSSCSL